MHTRNRLLVCFAWPLLFLLPNCHGEASNAENCPGCGTGGSPNLGLGTGGSGGIDAAAVDSCDLIRGIYGTWPDLWLDSCTVPLEMHLSDPEFVARLVVDCVVVPYASPDAGFDGWLYDDASRTLTLTGQPCDAFKAKGTAQLYVIQGGPVFAVWSATFLIHYVGADAG